MLVRTPYGWLDVRRKKGDVLQPSLVSRETLETYKRASAYKLKKLLAESMLDVSTLKEMLGKNF
jgi:hypothetical protein